MRRYIKVMVLQGILRSADGRLQRVCKVSVRRHTSSTDATAEPANITYSNIRILDRDDWPEGEYVLEVVGQRALFSKRSDDYRPR